MTLVVCHFLFSSHSHKVSNIMDSTIDFGEMANFIDLDYIAQNKIKQSIACFESSVDQDGESIYICLVHGCNKKIGCKSNAIRHIRRQHVQFFELIRHNKNTADGKKTNESLNQIDIRVKVNLQDIWNACVDLVVVNALPLSFVESVAFKKILSPYVIALKAKGIDLTVNSKTIKARIEEKAARMQEILKSKVENMPLCLMLDIGSRLGRSILGISVAFMDNGRKEILTLAMHELRVNATAHNLVVIIKQKVLEYGISMNQIVSVTTDNGKNLIKSVALLDAARQDENPLTTDSESEDENDEEVIDMDIFDGEYYADLLSNIQAEFRDASTDMIINVSCAAHGFHLVLTGAIAKSEGTKALIERTRGLSKKLRTPTYRNLLKDNNLNQASIDVTTRWNSTYDMVWYLKFYPNLFECTHTFCMFSDSKRVQSPRILFDQ